MHSLLRLGQVKIVTCAHTLFFLPLSPLGARVCECVCGVCPPSPCLSFSTLTVCHQHPHNTRTHILCLVQVTIVCASLCLSLSRTLSHTLAHSRTHIFVQCGDVASLLLLNGCFVAATKNTKEKEQKQNLPSCQNKI